MVVEQVHECLDLVGIALINSLTLLQLSPPSFIEAIIDRLELSGEFGPDFNAFRVG